LPVLNDSFGEAFEKNSRMEKQFENLMNDGFGHQRDRLVGHTTQLLYIVIVVELFAFLYLLNWPGIVNLKINLFFLPPMVLM